MAVLETISPAARERVESIGAADLVVALPGCRSVESLQAAVASLNPVLAALVADRRTVILHPETALPAGASAANEISTGNPSIQLLPCQLAPVERYHAQSLEQGLRSLLQVGGTLGARACVMLGAEPASTIPEGVRLLAEPVLNNGYDLAVPLFIRRKFDSLVNSGIAYPLTRALYGARLCYPMAADLAVSVRLANQYLQPSVTPGQPQSGWATMKAICSGLQVCQVQRDLPPTPSVTEPIDLSTSLAQVLSTLFLDMEGSATFWQRVRGSQSVRTFGVPKAVDHETTTSDVRNMIETFQRGCRDLIEIWAAALSPVTLIELKRLARLPAEQFRLADDVWVHVLYDFALGHRQRVMNREHLLRAFTPIYLGWVASYALEVQNMPPRAVEDRLEKLCMSFETLKPYLLSRWRWPDRFNP